MFNLTSIQTLMRFLLKYFCKFINKRNVEIDRLSYVNPNKVLLIINYINPEQINIVENLVLAIPFEGG